MVGQRSNFYVCVLFFLSLFSASVEAKSHEAVQVLVIHSYGPDVLWVKGINAGIHEILPANFSLSHLYLRTKRLAKIHHAEEADIAWSRFQELDPDLVVICDDNALKLLGERISQRKPVVFCGINGSIRSDYPWVIDGRAITGILERPVIRRATFMINKVLGLSARKALVLLGNSTTARAFFKTDLGNQQNTLIWENFSAEVRLADNLQSFQEELRRSKEEQFDFVVVAGHLALRDQSGRAVALDETNRWIARHSPIPAFTVHLNSIGKDKLIGGLTILGVMMGRETGHLVKKVIDAGGQTRGSPFIYFDHGQLVMSASELERHNLSIQDNFKDLVLLVD